MDVLKQILELEERISEQKTTSYEIVKMHEDSQLDEKY